MIRRFPLLAVVCALAIVGLVSRFAQAARTDRPNVLLIMSDDMGFSDIGCYGGEIDTPVLDGLAANGVRFTQFYNTGRCCPTRASLLTGLYPHQAGMGHMTGDRHLPGYSGGINGPCATIAEVLRPAGYGTYMVGKWHVTRHTDPRGPRHNWPLQRGFDKFYGTIKGGGSFFDPTSLCRGNRYITPVNDPDYRPERFYYTDAISDNAVAFLRAHDTDMPDCPFFMYVAYTCAHWPMHALPEDIARYKGRYDAGYGAVRAARVKRLEALGLIDATWELTPQAGAWSGDAAFRAWEIRCMEVYAAMIDNMDRGIGRMVAELKRQGRLDNTLILFLQDNGGCAEGMGRGNERRWQLAGVKPMAADALQPNIWPPMRTRDGRAVLGGPSVMPGPADSYIGYGKNWANVSNTPFREYKHWVHEGGIATPLVVHWPAGIKRRNALESQPAHLVDLMATCVDVAQAAYPATRDGRPVTPAEGRSLRPAFNGESVRRSEPIYWEHEGNRALRDGKWKLVAKGPKGAWELYDMSADRTEMHDLAERDPARVKRMVAQWEQWARRAHVIPWVWGGPYGEGAEASIGSRETRFSLKAGTRLARADCPRIAGRGFRIVADIEYTGKDGVIVAQGGSHLGFALYVERGLPVLAVRDDGKLGLVRGNSRLPQGTVRLGATLTRSGNVTFEVDGKQVGAGTVPGPLKGMPLDGLEVGCDATGAVGTYTVPHAFGGRVLQVEIELRNE